MASIDIKYRVNKDMLRLPSGPGGILDNHQKTNVNA